MHDFSLLRTNHTKSTKDSITEISMTIFRMNCLNIIHLSHSFQLLYTFQINQTSSQLAAIKHFLCDIVAGGFHLLEYISLN